jgi:hypothetical protein
MRQFLHRSIPVHEFMFCMATCMAHIVRQESAILVCMHTCSAACQRLWSGKKDVHRKIWQRRAAWVRIWSQIGSEYGYVRTAAITCRQKSDTRGSSEHACKSEDDGIIWRHAWGDRNTAAAQQRTCERRRWAAYVTTVLHTHKTHACMRQASSPRIHLLHGACLRT